MRRLHLFEIGDQQWCPRALRDATTDLLELCFRTWNYYAPVVPLLTAAIERTGDREIVDLCSGGGGPWPSLLSVQGDQWPLCVVLTDKYPNAAGARRVEEASDGRIRSDTRSIDAMAVPTDLRGFRTMFTSFHHFSPDAAHAILADAVQGQVGIGVFEFTGRSLRWFVAVVLTPFAVLYAVPFLRPLRWRTLLFTYLIPVIPLGVLFDGIVSCLRTYSPSELDELVEPLRGNGYTWEVGEARGGQWKLPITYLLGYPTSNGDGPATRGGRVAGVRSGS
jgi:hypothetical protein